jgi:tripartite-type tricarboxylate transporter receptor subunit TctC
MERAMQYSRRRFLAVAAGAVVTPAVASAQTYPSRPVRLVVGFPAGGSADIGARIIGQYLTERLGQPVIIENRPGAASNVATEAVVRAAADGYTLALVNSSQTINATLYDKLSYNFVRDIAPVASIYHQPLVLEVQPSVPAHSVPEFIAYAKSNGRTMNMASAGIGSPQHVAGELFKMMAGVEMQHVPYRGVAPALSDLMGGQVQVMFDTLNSSIEHIKAGKLRALGVTTASRSSALPDIPAIGEFVPGYDVVAWSGIGAPTGTPAEIIATLNREINAGLDDTKVKGRFESLGVTVLAQSPGAFRTFVAEDAAKWAKVIKFAGLKAE